MTAELRRVGQVQDLEPDLPDVVAEQRRVLGDHQVDVLAELIARVADRCAGRCRRCRRRGWRRRRIEVAGVRRCRRRPRDRRRCPSVFGSPISVGALPAAEEPEVGVGHAGRHDRVQRRAADQFDDRRRIPAVEEQSRNPALAGVGELHDRRQDDAVRRVEVADAVLGVEVVVVLRQRRSGSGRCCPAPNWLSFGPAQRVAEAAAPPAGRCACRA